MWTPPHACWERACAELVGVRVCIRRGGGCVALAATETGLAGAPVCAVLAAARATMQRVWCMVLIVVHLFNHLLLTSAEGKLKANTCAGGSTPRSTVTSIALMHPPVCAACPSASPASSCSRALPSTSAMQTALRQCKLLQLDSPHADQPAGS